MILGLGYNKVYPEVIHILPNGLQILKYKFLLVVNSEVCCVGGPLGTLSHMVQNMGVKSAMWYMSHPITNYKLNIELFPSIKPQESVDEGHKVKNPLNIRKGGKDQRDSSFINKVSSAEMFKHKEGGKHSEESSQIKQKLKL